MILIIHRTDKVIITQLIQNIMKDIILLVYLLVQFPMI